MASLDLSFLNAKDPFNARESIHSIGAMTQEAEASHQDSADGIHNVSFPLPPDLPTLDGISAKFCSKLNKDIKFNHGTTMATCTLLVTCCL